MVVQDINSLLSEQARKVSKTLFLRWLLRVFMNTLVIERELEKET